MNIFVLVKLVYCFSFFPSYPCLRQPTTEKVQCHTEKQKNAINLLKTVANCLQKECEQWVANIQALLKAKAEEEKKIRQAQEKVEADEKKRVLKAEIRAQKLAEEEAAASAALVPEEEDEEEDEGDGKKKRKGRRQRVNKPDLTEDDPQILRDISKLPAMHSAEIAGDIGQLLDVVSANPKAACLGRLKKAPVKKLLQDGHLFSNFKV